MSLPRLTCAKSVPFLSGVSLGTLRWFRDRYDELLDHPPTANTSVRVSYALLNAEISRRLYAQHHPNIFADSAIAMRTRKERERDALDNVAS